MVRPAVCSLFTDRTEKAWRGLRECVTLKTLGEAASGIRDFRHCRSLRPTRSPYGNHRHGNSVTQTGHNLAQALATQMRTEEEDDMVRRLLERAGKGSVATRDWDDPWYCCDYSADKTELQALRTYQTKTHGAFDMRGLLASKVAGDGILLGPDGQQIKTKDFARISHTGDTIGDIVTIERLDAFRVRFKSNKLEYPLAPAAAHAFRLFCDILVFNYPGVLAPQDPADFVHVVPATSDVWRLQKKEGGRYTLLWEPTPINSFDVGEVTTVSDITAIVRRTIDAPAARAHPHPWLTPIRSIWRPVEAVITKTRASRLVRAAAATRGRAEVDHRQRRLIAKDHDIGTALAKLTWKGIDRLLGTTSRQRLHLRKLKGDRFSGWDRLHHKHGCPHCPTEKQGGRVQHIFWECPGAQALWRVLKESWNRYRLWDGPEAQKAFKAAVFDFRLPHFPAELWKLPELARISKQDTEGINAVHQAAQMAWQQQVLDTLLVIWRWRHHIVEGTQQWTQERATMYLQGVLRSTLRGLDRRLPATKHLRDPRTQLLEELASGLTTAELDTEEPEPSSSAPRYILFFDGGSRGNPGPGGAGAVIVATNDDAINAQVVWSACMSYAQRDMTNNKAEYLGLIAGLQAAKDNQWQVEVVGDSSLILRQVREYRPPRSPGLQSLYTIARRLADDVRVRVWQHHVRAYNKMADYAANVAMDTQSSVQVHHPSSRPHTATIASYLSGDFDEWRTRHLLRISRD